MGGEYKDHNKRRATWRNYHKRKKAEINEARRSRYESVVFPKHLQKKYGITKEQYDEMLIRQNGVCAITGLPPAEGEKLQVDHDHVTKRVRGLIRKEINKALGQFQDNSEWLRKAAEYLEERQ